MSDSSRPFADAFTADEALGLFKLIEQEQLSIIAPDHIDNSWLVATREDLAVARGATLTEAMRELVTKFGNWKDVQ